MPVDPLVGLELEFYHQSITQADFDVYNQEDRNTMSKLYSEFIVGWIEQYETLFKYKVEPEWIQENLEKTKHKEQVFCGYFVFKLSIWHLKTTEDGKREGKQISYWIKPTLDPGCIEVVATPLCVSDYCNKDFRQTFEFLLFGIMKNLGFYTDTTNLGESNNTAAGHLNVDYKTGFNGNFDNVLRCMLYIAGNIRGEDDLLKLRYHGSTSQSDYIDPYNSLYMSDLYNSKIKHEFLDDMNSLMLLIYERYTAAVEAIINKTSFSIFSKRDKLKALMEQVRAIYIQIPEFSDDLDKEYYDKTKKEHKEALEKLIGAKTIIPSSKNVKAIDFILAERLNGLKTKEVVQEKKNDTWTEHYIAINTESFPTNDDKNNGIKQDQDTWRVEFRAVRMPNDYDQLLQQFEIIVKCIEPCNY